MKPEDVRAGPVLLDTDVLSWLLTERGPYEQFGALVDGHAFALSFASVGELRAGALMAKWGQRRVTDLEERISRCLILPATNAVTTVWAEFYAKARGQLRGNGANDMWIAACAAAQEPALPIATGNLSDFRTLSTVRPLDLVHPDL